MMKQKHFFFFLYLLFALQACSLFDEKGKEYQNYQELVQDQQDRAYTFIGKFNESWPATVIEIKKSENQLYFLEENSVPHHYEGFDGYELKLLVLKTYKKNAYFIFRSKNKK